MNTSILVIKLGALGDIALAWESFQSIRAHHPNANITLLTRRPFVSLAKLMPWFDQVWTDPAPKIWQLGTLWRFQRQLRAANFTRIYDLQGNDRVQFYRRLGGWPASRWVPASLSEKGVRRQKAPPATVAERHRQMLAAGGVPATGPADLSWLTAPLDDLGLPEKFVVLIPGCSPTQLLKRWPPECYAEIGRRLIAQGLTPVIIGTDADEPAISLLHAAVPGAVNLRGSTTIPQLAAVARRAVGVIGNDTGPMHIAALLGTPTLILLSAQSDPRRMKPPGQHVNYLKEQRLADLSPATVWDAWQKQRDSKSATPR